MGETAETELLAIGREAARQVVGEDAGEHVEVRDGLDSTDQLAYYFTFLVDRDRERQRAGLVRTRLVQKLRDALMARGDDHYPVVQILDRADWEKRAGA